MLLFWLFPSAMVLFLCCPVLPLFPSRRAQLLAWTVEAAVLDMRARGIESVLEAALRPDGIPTTVYTQLLSTVQAALPRTLHKYMALRRRLLAAQSSTEGAFQLRPWDVRAGEPRPFVC